MYLTCGVLQLQQDATLGTDLPTFLTNSTTYNSSIPLINQTIIWDSLPMGWDGFSLLVDDVERLVGTALNFSLAALDANLPHFFRLAVRAYTLRTHQLNDGGTAHL